MMMVMMRLKNGFIVDNFSGHAIGDYESPDYKVAVDFQKREIQSNGI